MRKPAKPVCCGGQDGFARRCSSNSGTDRPLSRQRWRNLHPGSLKRPSRSRFRLMVVVTPYHSFSVLFLVLLLWIVVQYRILSSFHIFIQQDDTSNNQPKRTSSVTRERRELEKSLNQYYTLPQKQQQKQSVRGLPSLNVNFTTATHESDPSHPEERRSDIDRFWWESIMNKPAIPSSIYNPKSTNPLPIVYISGPVVPKDGNHKQKHGEEEEQDRLLDALERSRYILVVAKLSPLNSTHVQQTQWETLSSSHPATTPPLVILVDWAGLRRDCHALHRILSFIRIQNRTKQQRVWKRAKPFLLLLDSTASVKSVTCTSDDWNNDFIVQMAKRSIVEGRRWNYSREWIEPGQILPPSKNTTTTSAIPILQWTGSISESFVKELRSANSNHEDDDKNSGSSNDSRRTWDVSHFWQATSARTPHGGGIYNALRQSIGEALNDTAQETMITYANYLGFRSESAAEIDIEGEKMDEEDDFEEMDAHTTVLQLARSKIVVVSQSDEYEDHDDRLFEALASGALVLADEMVAPPVGLKNKTNIIFFNGTDVLDSLIRFYLKHSELRQKIARHGMEYALGRHRSWHVLEKLLFGKALTRTDKAPLDAEGPAKRKHAMEKSTIVSLVM